MGGTGPELAEGWRQEHASQMLSTGRKWGKQFIIHMGKLRLREEQTAAKYCRTGRN